MFIFVSYVQYKTIIIKLYVIPYVFKPRTYWHIFKFRLKTKLQEGEGKLGFYIHDQQIIS